MRTVIATVAALLLLPTASRAEEVSWPQYDENPKVIRLDVPAPEDSAGGVIAADLDGDTRPDYLVTVPGRVAAYRNDGKRLWVLEEPAQVGGQSESQGLPGHHGPGVQAGDVDGDGNAEVLFLTREGFLRVVDGASGVSEARIALAHPEGTERWEHAVIAAFRDAKDRDLLLQATNRKGYRMGRFVAAYPIERLLERGRSEESVPLDDALWRTDEFLACAHNGARIADLDGDGRDEVLGGTVLSPEGKLLHRIPLRGHVDSIFTRDVRPDIEGLEIVALEEGGGNRVFLYGATEGLWTSDYEKQEPQNAGVGDLDPTREGLEVWCRSRYAKHQKPFTFDARGGLLSHYAMDDVAPAGWTDSGVEVIWTIDWTGGKKQLLCAKERHTEGDVAVFDGITGRFIERFDEEAARLYVADVSGDWREEVIVLNGSKRPELRIYHNPAPNERPGRPRLWKEQHYRRSKMTYNYYSP